MRFGLAGSLLLAAALMATAAAGAIREPETQSVGPIDLRLEGDRLSLDLPEPMPLREVLRAIGSASGLELVVRREPGFVGPLALDGLPLAEALLRLAGRHSLVLRYERADAAAPARIVYVLLIANDGGEPASPPTRQRRLAAEPTAHGAAPIEDERNDRATILRDIVKLSYRRDEGAVTELRLILESQDPQLRAAAVSALAGVGGKTAARLISERGLTDLDAGVRLSAAQGLWRTQGPDARNRLVSVAGFERDAEVRRAIGELLRGSPAQERGAEPGPHPRRLPR